MSLIKGGLVGLRSNVSGIFKKSFHRTFISLKTTKIDFKAVFRFFVS